MRIQNDSLRCSFVIDTRIRSNTGMKNIERLKLLVVESSGVIFTRLYLSLPTFHFRGRKNEYSAQRLCRPLLATRYHIRNQGSRKYREKSKSRNDAPDAEV